MSIIFIIPSLLLVKENPQPRIPLFSNHSKNGGINIPVSLMRQSRAIQCRQTTPGIYCQMIRPSLCRRSHAHWYPPALYARKNKGLDLVSCTMLIRLYINDEKGDLYKHITQQARSICDPTRVNEAL